MGIFGIGDRRQIEEINNYIARMECKLSTNYKNGWQEWKRRRDIVAKEMGLKDIEIAYVTKYVFADFFRQNLKKYMGINEQNKEKIFHTRGNTSLFEVLGEMNEIRRDCGKKCARFLPQFEKRILEIKPINKR